MILNSPFVEGREVVTEDAIELLDSQRFRLTGRLDRTVKVAEKRLSLPEMEERLQQHDWVDLCAMAITGSDRKVVGALVVLSDEGCAVAEKAGRAAVSQQLREHLAKWYDRVVLPRRWRYPDQLPWDERGKLPAAAIERLLTLPASPTDLILPKAVRVVREGSDGVTVDFLVAADSPAFDGHFPGNPILPGVVQIHWAMHFANELLDFDINRFESIKNLKFKQPIEPKTWLKLNLVTAACGHTLRFSYSSKRGIHSSGLIALIKGGID